MCFCGRYESNHNIQPQRYEAIVLSQEKMKHRTKSMYMRQKHDQIDTKI